MFTTMPTLTERVERLLGETPVIDSLSRLRVDRPFADDFRSLLQCDWVQNGLRAVGMPNDLTDPILPAEDLVSRVSPYLARLKNTTTSWCLSRIYRDLFDHFDPLPSASLALAVEAAAEPNRAWRILKGDCRIETAVTDLENASSRAEDPDFFRFRLNLTSLIDPSPSSAGTSENGYVDRLETTLDNWFGTADRLRRALFDRLDRTVVGRTRFTGAFLSIRNRFFAADDFRIDRLLGSLRSGRIADETEVKELAGFVAWNVFAWHHERRKAIQIVLADRQALAVESVAGSPTSWASELARAFQSFPQARFGLTIASESLESEIAAAAGRLPNVHASAYWIGDLTPIALEKIFAGRLQTVPMTKFTGFLGDAPCAEWTYARLKLVKKAAAAAIARQVEERFLDEDDLPSLLKQIFQDSPRDLYDLA